VTGVVDRVLVAHGKDGRWQVLEHLAQDQAVSFFFLNVFD
jgi:hypothetical protein